MINLPTSVTTGLCPEHPPSASYTIAARTREHPSGFQNKFTENKNRKLPLSLLLQLEEVVNGRSAAKQVYLVSVFSKSGIETEMWEAIVQKEVVGIEITILWETK